MDPIVIFGAGKAAEVASFYIERFSDYEIAGYTVDDEFVDADAFNGKPLVPWSGLEQHFPPGRFRLLGPITAARLNAVRRDRFREGKQRGYEFASFMHPQTRNYGNAIGDNCLILDDCTIQPFAEIGDNVIIWSKSIIGHHTQVGPDCFLSSQVTIGARACVGRESYFGTLCAVLSGYTLGARSVVLNGAIVTQNGSDEAVFVGAKPREIRGGRNRILKLL